MLVGSIVGFTGQTMHPLAQDLPPKAMSRSAVEQQDRPQRRFIFHTQWSQAKRISTVASTVDHQFLAIEERGFVRCSVDRLWRSRFELHSRKRIWFCCKDRSPYMCLPLSRARRHACLALELHG